MSSSLSSTELLDLSGLTCTDPAAAAPHPQEQAVAYVDAASGNAVVCGGYSYEDGANTDYDSCMEYDAGTNSWALSMAFPALLEKRFGAAGALFDDDAAGTQFWVTGGRNLKSGILQTSEIISGLAPSVPGTTYV